VNWLLQIEFAYNSSRALGIEHTPFEANYGLSHGEAMDLLLPMRPSIPISKAVGERLQHLRGVHELVIFVLRVHKDNMKARSHSATAPNFSEVRRFGYYK
jgi:hypothetical protein